MVLGKSYLTPPIAKTVNQARRNITATKIALQEPNVEIEIYRNVAGVDSILAPQIVALKLNTDALSNADSSSDSVTARTLTGTVQNELLDIKPGDRFRIDNRWWAYVTAVRPSRAGVIIADIRVDAGGIG